MWFFKALFEKKLHLHVVLVLVAEAFLLPLDGMLLHPKVTLRNFVSFPWQISCTYLYSWVGRGTVKGKCPAWEHNIDPAKMWTGTSPPLVQGVITKAISSAHNYRDHIKNFMMRFAFCWCWCTVYCQKYCHTLVLSYSMCVISAKTLFLLTLLQ